MSKTDSTRGDEQRWAELADLAAMISREIQHHAGDPGAVLLTRSEYVVMCHLLRGDAATPSRIAAATGLLRPNVSAALRTLRSKGLIDKRTDPTDGRGVTVRPTPLGRARYELVRRERANAVARAAGHDTTDLDAAIGLLTKVSEGLRNDRPTGPS
jgi:DNA-binding MarR family transcriptional regulator